MRRHLLVAMLVLTLPVAGCGSGSGTDAGPATGSAASAPTGSGSPPSGPESSGPARPDPTSPAGKPPLKPSPSPSASGGARVDPENPRDLVGAPVVLTGTVSRRGGCVVLDAGGHRWALTGDAAAQLTDGRRVTVRGRSVAVPAGCDAAYALALRGTPGR